MAKQPYRKCRGCGATAEERSLSARGWCIDCGLGVMLENMRQLHDHSGPAYNLWKLRHAAGVARYLASLESFEDELARMLDQVDKA